MIEPHDPWSAHLSLLYVEHPVAERPAAARADGFRWVESWWIDDERERAALLDAVRAEGLGLACLNAAAGDLAQGERGLLNVPTERDAAMAAVVVAVDLVAPLGGRAVNVLVGRALADISHTRQVDAVRGALRELAPHAAARDIALVVEHVNESDIPGYLVPTPAAAAALVEAVDHDAVRLLYDAYHAARMEIDAVADVPSYVDLIGHAQYADAPARSAPGTGHGDPRGFSAALAKGGYDGPIGLEYAPAGATSMSLAGLRG